MGSGSGEELCLLFSHLTFIRLLACLSDAIVVWLFNSFLTALSSLSTSSECVRESKCALCYETHENLWSFQRRRHKTSMRIIFHSFWNLLFPFHSQRAARERWANATSQWFIINILALHTQREQHYALILRQFARWMEGENEILRAHQLF